jgi:glycosyltransferase involved in cell wall biosynthesis
MNIGVIGHGFVDWVGGIDFLKIIVSSLLAIDTEKKHNIHILLPMHGPIATIKNFLIHSYISSKSIVYSSRIENKPITCEIVLNILSDFNDKVTIHKIDLGYSALHRAIYKLQLDVLIPAFIPIPGSLSTPWVGYIYDFQHKYLSHFFSKRVIVKRDKAFLNMLTSAKAVIVNSNSVASDIEIFVPEATADLFVLPFCAAPHTSWFHESTNAARKYDINNRYFIICNQFWKHKDHVTAFNAFAQLSADNPDIMLVCTGKTYDHRDPKYFSRLMLLLKNHRIQDRVRILGLIPKQDQINLIKDSMALIQPTLFEGGPGGGATYDAVSLGIPVILSDIPVNKEITNEGIHFFSAGNSASLVPVLSEFLNKTTQTKTNPELLISIGDSRRKACGQVLMRAINAVL